MLTTYPMYTCKIQEQRESVYSFWIISSIVKQQMVFHSCTVTLAWSGTKFSFRSRILNLQNFLQSLWYNGRETNFSAAPPTPKIKKKIKEKEPWNLEIDMIFTPKVGRSSEIMFSTLDVECIVMVHTQFTWSAVLIGSLYLFHTCSGSVPEKASLHRTEFGAQPTCTNPLIKDYLIICFSLILP